MNESVPPTFFFSGPTKTVVAYGRGQIFRGALGQRETWLPDLTSYLRRSKSKPDRLVVGAVPFSPDANIHLFCPIRSEAAVRRRDYEPVLSSCHRPPASRTHPLVHTSDIEFVDAVGRTTQAIATGDLKKVVLSRAKDIPLSIVPDLGRVLDKLRSANPYSFTYALDLDRHANATLPATLIGVSPELLLSRRGRRVVTVPMAGSVPRAANSAEDDARVERFGLLSNIC